MLYFWTHSSTPYNKNMFHDLSIIGGTLYVMRDGLIKYFRFCPKCVSIRQNWMWRSTPRRAHLRLMGRKSLRKPGALKLFLVHWVFHQLNTLISHRQGMTQQEGIPFWLQSQLAWCVSPSGNTLWARMWANSAYYRKFPGVSNCTGQGSMQYDNDILKTITV